MKKVLLQALTLLTLTSAFGQDYCGFKGGLNLANVGKDGHENAKTRTGLHVGALLQVGLTNKLLIRPEILYTVKGFRLPAAQSSTKSTIQLNYVSLPVLLGFRATDMLTVLAGPELGYLASARLKVDGNNINVSDRYREWDLGLNLGIAYKMTNRLGIDLRYSYGFQSLVDVIFTDRNGNTIGNGKVDANRVVQIGLYYFIPR